MAFDSQRGRTVLFGGSSGSAPLGDTWEYTGGVVLANHAPYGSGCGSPALALLPVWNGSPRINTTAQVSLTNIPSMVAFVVLGWSRTVCGPSSLPMSLAGFGMPGCDLLQSAEAGAVPLRFTSASTANCSVLVPNIPGLVGLHVYLQGGAFAPGVNPGALIVSNGIDWGVGS